MEFRTAVPSAVMVGALLGAAVVALNLPPIGEPRPLLLSGIPLDVTAVVQWDLPVVRNEPVQRFVNLFQNQQSDRMALYLKRSGRYEGMIRSKLREKGMPEDLLYLSMIESGFNPNARSSAHAVGLWQFIAATGRLYGLRIDSYVDERRDPEKSTDAALSYLQDLHEQFGSWNLAAAAYNSGSDRVARVMREETGSVRGEENDFWRIRRRLPSDTREYVPLIYAAALIGKEPQKYGLDQVERLLPLPVETLMVPGGTSLDMVGRAIGVAGVDLKQLNQHLLKGATPPGEESYPVVVPMGRAHLFSDNFAAIQAESKLAEVTQAAASQQESKPSLVPQVIAMQDVSNRSQAIQSADDERTATSVPPSSQSRTHRVASGESLWTIARRHGTTVATLRSANNLGLRTTIRPGQMLRIPG